MNTLLLQTFLLLLGSFFLGCAIACVFKRLFIPRSADVRSSPSVQASRVAAPMPAPLPAAPITASAPPPPSAAARPSETARFERALTGQTAPSAPAAPRPAASSPASVGPVVEVEPPAPKPTPAQYQPQAQPMQPASAPVAQPSAPAAVAAANAPAARPAAPAPQPVPTTPQTAAPSSPAASVGGVASAAAAAAAAAAAVAAARPSEPAARPVTPAAPVSPAAPASAPGPADDLTRIRAIDPDLQDRLNRLGVRRFADIAGWSAGDVNRMSQTLGFAGRIEQENWIEQAHILSKGGETEYSRRRAAGLPAAAPAPSPTASPAAAAPASVVATPQPAAPAPAQSAAKEGELRPFGVSTRSGGISVDATTAAAAAAIAAAAASAASGSQTAPAAQRPAPPPPPPPAASVATPAATVATAASPAVPANTIISDRLHRILGVNAEAERILIANGITRFSQIAGWSQADVDRFDLLLGKPGRIGRENWIEQAKVLVRSAEDTDASRPVRLADAIRDNAGAGQRAPRTDLGHLRSVRSEALRGEPPEVVRPSVLARPVGGFEDLKRIRGIGVLIEKKLNSLGIISYEQIANWTGADIDRISQILDFKGRIERENWVEQARILAAGGNTEFSRRMDRGDM